MSNLTRKDFLRLMAGTSAATMLGTMPAGFALAGAEGPILKRAIPKSGELLPVVGLGTAQDFGVADDPEIYQARVDVIQAFA